MVVDTTSAKSIAAEMTNGGPPGEEIIANILHVLSSSTRLSPLICKRSANNTNRHDWDPLYSFAIYKESCDSFLFRWLTDCISTLNSSTSCCTDNEEGIIMDAFVNTSQMENIVANSPGDDRLWFAGLKLLKTRLFPPIHDDGRCDSIPPHIILQTVLDSYYCTDTDLILGEPSPNCCDGERSDDITIFRLPTSIGMFYLRTVLISHVLDQANNSSNTKVRWRRLKSMTDDARSLFQRMLLDYAAKSMDSNFYPSLIMPIATWCYTNHLFPSCHQLIEKLLWNEVANPSKGTNHGVMLLQSCYDSFRLMTTLLALDVAISYNPESPSRNLLMILKCIDCQKTNDFFELVRSMHDKMPDMGDQLLSWWNPDTGRGLLLEEDLLLFPCSDAKSYDGIGIALVASWRLQIQANTTPELSEICPLPSPYSSSHFWTLLFPHILTMLSGWESSTTLGSLSIDEDCQRRVNVNIMAMGFDMLHTILNKTHVIRPIASIPLPTVLDSRARWAHSAQGLAKTVYLLHSHVVAISSLEIQVEMTFTSPFDIYPALKYSSLEVMAMIRALFGTFNKGIQIETIAYLCEQMKTSHVKVLLPRVIDLLRPIVNEMIGNIKQCKSNIIVGQDIPNMKSITVIMDDHIMELLDFFDNHESPLPIDVSEFMASTETYSAVFAVMRLIRIWVAQSQSEIVKEVMGEYIVGWIDAALSKLHYFNFTLARLIQIWESPSPRTVQHNRGNPPQDWYLLYLLQNSLRDTLNIV